MLFVGLNSSAQINIKSENPFTYKKGIDKNVLTFYTCCSSFIDDTIIQVYKNNILIYSFDYVLCEKKYFKDLPAGKYYFSGTTFEDSIVIKNTDKIFIKNELLNTKP